MTRTSGRIRTAAAVAAALAAGVSAGCTGANANSGGETHQAANGVAATGQRVAIEERWKDGAPQGTFRLIPLSPGPVTADSGTFTFPDAPSKVSIRNGQTITTYQGTDLLHSPRGTLTIANVQAFTDAGTNYEAAAGTWRIRAGTGNYRLVNGRGRGTTVSTPGGLVITRYEGYLRTG